MLPVWIEKMFQSYKVIKILAVCSALVLLSLYGQTLGWRWTIPFMSPGVVSSFVNLIKVDAAGASDEIAGRHNWTEGSTFDSCPDILNRVVSGQWVKHGNFTQREVNLAEEAMRKTLAHNHIYRLQKNDNRCGNSDINMYFKALWEPEGKTPCCASFTCVDRPVEQCQGPLTYDLRQQVKAEFATWTPADTSCKIVDVTTEEKACHVIHNMTLYFIGDSLVRQLYISVLGFLRDRAYESRVLNVSSSQALECHTYYRYSPPCANFILNDAIECFGTTRLHYRRLLSSDEAQQILEEFRDLKGVNNSWYISGLGFHDKFESKPVIERVMNPIFQEMSTSAWPKFIWMSTHIIFTLLSTLLIEESCE